MGVAGPMARGAEDLRIMLEVIGGQVPGEAVALQWKLPPARRARLRDYRIGYVLDDPFCAVTAEVRDVLTNAIDALRKAGVNLREGWPAGIDPEALFDAYYFLLMARNLAGTVTEWQRSQPESDADAPWQYYEKKMREAARRVLRGLGRANGVTVARTGRMAGILQDVRCLSAARQFRRGFSPRP